MQLEKNLLNVSFILDVIRLWSVQEGLSRVHGVGSRKEKKRGVIETSSWTFLPHLESQRSKEGKGFWHGNYQVRLSWPSVCIRLANGHARLELSIGRETWLEHWDFQIQSEPWIIWWVLGNTGGGGKSRAGWTGWHFIHHHWLIYKSILDTRQYHVFFALRGSGIYKL